MNARGRRRPVRRQPRQLRARQTVDAILEAVSRLLKRGGVDAVTTNRVAEVAGVSIGSVYQYFPDKRALFVALHERHAEAMGRLVEETLVAHADAPLEPLVRALVHALVDAHAADPRLHEALREVPHKADAERGLAARLQGAFRLALAARALRRRAPAELERRLFVVSHLIDSLAHAAALARPARLSLTAARHEAVRAVLAYLRA
jgi:AcrR family transcriptional regulator